MLRAAIIVPLENGFPVAYPCNLKRKQTQSETEPFWQIVINGVVHVWAIPASTQNTVNEGPCNWAAEFSAPDFATKTGFI
jgi:hypothetical protein